MSVLNPAGKHNLHADANTHHRAIAHEALVNDVAAAHYIRETGRSWVPSSGNRISLGVTAGIVDGPLVVLDDDVPASEVGLPAAGGRVKLVDKV